MENASILSLIQNIAILLAIALLFDLSMKRWAPGKFHPSQLLTGAIIGGIGIILFLTPWSFVPGVIIDTRSILLPIAGLFFGTIPTCVAMLVMIAYRIYLGGIGVVPGILLILSSGLSGIIWRHSRKGQLLAVSLSELYFLGLVTQVLMLLWTFLFPWDIAEKIFRNILMPVLVFFPAVTSLIGQVMINHLKREKLTADLRNEDLRLRTLLDVLQYQSEELDPLFQYTLKQANKITNSQNIFLYQIDNGSVSLINKIVDSQYKEQDLLNDLEKLNILSLAAEGNITITINENTITPVEYMGILQSERLFNHYMAMPYTDINLVEAVIIVSNQTHAYTETEELHTRLFLDAIWKIKKRHTAEKALQSIEWMLSKKSTESSKISYPLHWEEFTSLNIDGLIINSVDHSLLHGIASEYLNLLDTSFSIVEKNGDYVLAIYSSSWCKLLNEASRNLTKSKTIHGALKSEKWHCHQSWWKEAAQKSIETNSITDIACNGGLNIYSVPIVIKNDVIGAISLGYGNPPKDKQTIQNLAQKYQIEENVLLDLAESYESRPPFIIELAKQRLQSSANVIALLVELKLAQQELHRNEEKLNKIFEVLPVGLWFADKYGNLFRTNTMGAQIWGAEPKVSIEEYGLFRARFYPSLKEIGAEDWALYKTIKEGKTIENELLEIDTFDGKKKIILNYSTPITMPSGEIDGAIVVNLDVTDRIKAEEDVRTAQMEMQRLLKDADQARQVLLSVIEDQKLAEEKIQQLNQELEQRVKERTAQLEVANRELEAFAYSVSHDLRAPLRAMDGFSAALMEDFPDNLDKQAKHYLERIQQASQRMGQLIEDLLHLSRVTRREINIEAIDLSIIAKDIAKDIQTQNENRAIKFEIMESMPVNGDAHLLRIALENLMSNATKFSSNKKHALITVGMLQNENEKIYYVKDNGVGFNMKYSDKLFNPFQRLHSMEEFPGTGIGLVTVQRIINRHGGKIWPEAKLDKGATFYFTLGG